MEYLTCISLISFFLSLICALRPEMLMTINTRAFYLYSREVMVSKEPYRYETCTELECLSCAFRFRFELFSCPLLFWFCSTFCFLGVFFVFFVALCKL